MVLEMMALIELYIYAPSIRLLHKPLAYFAQFCQQDQRPLKSVSLITSQFAVIYEKYVL